VFCPKCGDEYQPGFNHCVDCDADLVEKVPATLAGLKAEFGRRQRTLVVAPFLLLAIGAAVCVFLSYIGAGKATLVGAVSAMAILARLFMYRQWRCPACDRPLDVEWNGNPKHWLTSCGHCGARLV
jgi:hypothetical protein